MGIADGEVKKQMASRGGWKDATKDKDTVTYNMAHTILEQEVEHEEDLQSLRADLDLMVERGSRCRCGAPAPI